MTRIACLWIPWFTAAAHLRSEPSLGDRPLAVLTGTSPAARVNEANSAAREHGVHPGMAEAEARARCPQLVTRSVSEVLVASARHAMLDAVLGVSPRVEDGGPGMVYADIDGLGRLFGDDVAIARRLLRAARAVGLTGHVGVAGSRTAARIAARGSQSITVVPRGDDETWLASASLDMLELPAALAETLACWGVVTLGALATLPRNGLAVRLGAVGLVAQAQARGEDREPFVPYTPPPFWEEAQGLDWEIDSWPALAVVVGTVLERLCARLATAYVSADVLVVRLGLATGAHDERMVSLAYPSRQASAMLSLIGLEIEAHPVAAAVTHVSISAHAVRVTPGPATLWQPPSPAVRDLAAVLARLAALVGRENVGSPVVLDSHRPDAIMLTTFDPSSGGELAEASGGEPAPRLAFRRLRPPRPVDVDAVSGDPRGVRLRADRAAAMEPVVACAGPWRASGQWWDERAWARDEWDVAFADGLLCRLSHDRLTGHWYLDGAYD